MHCRRFLLLLAASLVLPAAGAWSQGGDTDGIVLLIKSWRWESDGARSTIDFSSDAVMLLDGVPLEYEFSKGRILFPSGDAPVAYSYDGLRDRLTLRFSDGAQVEHRRTIASVLSRRAGRAPTSNNGRLLGKFCGRMFMANGELSLRAAFFFPDGGFDFSPRPTFASTVGEDRNPLGTALLWGNRIIFAFDNGTAAEADVVARDVHGAVVGFRYLRDLYTMAACRPLDESEPLLLQAPLAPSPRTPDN